MKIVKETNEYYITEWLYDGAPIYIRRWKQDGTTECKVTDHFAKCNGFKDVPDMIVQTLGKAKFDGVPEWLRVDFKEKCFFVGLPKGKLN